VTHVVGEPKVRIPASESVEADDRVVFEETTWLVTRRERASAATDTLYLRDITGEDDDA